MERFVSLWENYGYVILNLEEDAVATKQVDVQARSTFRKNPLLLENPCLLYSPALVVMQINMQTLSQSFQFTTL